MNTNWCEDANVVAGIGDRGDQNQRDSENAIGVSINTGLEAGA
jgi:hypothetical protein